MLEKLTQKQMYEGQFILLRYLQQMQHEGFQGLLVVVGQEGLKHVAEGDVVCFISDDGFDRNTPETHPEDMNYIIKQDHRIERIEEGKNGESLSLTVRGSRVEILPEGKPIVVKPATRD